jgi:hypothetical protein
MCTKLICHYNIDQNLHHTGKKELMPSPCVINGCVHIDTLDMQYLYFRTHRHYSKKGSRWSAYEVKTEKSYPHVPSIMRGTIEARLGDV